MVKQLGIGGCLSIDEYLKLAPEQSISDRVELFLMGLLSFALDIGYQELSEGYVSKCHLCLDIRKYLASNGDYDELQPGQFYEQLKTE
jgi:hypothetical protein